MRTKNDAAGLKGRKIGEMYGVRSKWLEVVLSFPIIFEVKEMQ